MHLRARHVPPVVGLLAVGCEAVAFVVFLVGLNFPSEGWIGAVVLLWVCGVVGALAALVLGVMVDSSGPALPLALLAFFLAVVPIAPLLFLLTRDW